MTRIAPDTLAATCAERLYENQADDIDVMHVHELTTIGEYFIVATGRNPRHLRALARETEDLAAEFDKEPLGVEGVPESGWILVDLGDVVVHIFDEKRRSLYQLNVLWGDAEFRDWEEMTGD
ncbi:MAG: ribosome silencing factor [Planctomycetota bacterium]